jgi:O-acetylserine/cysteine efflux transporter
VQVAALALATGGIVVIAAHVDASTTVLGLAMTLAAGLSWALANLTIRASGPVNVAAYVAWASLFATAPLFLMSLAFEGPAAIAAGLHRATWVTWLVVFWQSYANVMFGFAFWGWLLARYAAATITPTALLVPVFGMGASAALLGEPLPPWKLLAAGLVIAGLAIGMLWPVRPLSARPGAA